MYDDDYDEDDNGEYFLIMRRIMKRVQLCELSELLDYLCQKVPGGRENE